MMVEPSADVKVAIPLLEEPYDGLDSAVQHLGVVGVGVELHFFSFLLSPSVLHTVKLSLGSGLTVPVCRAVRKFGWFGQ